MKKRYALVNLGQNSSYDVCKTALQFYDIEIDHCQNNEDVDLDLLYQHDVDRKMIAYLKFTTEYQPLNDYPIYPLSGVSKINKLEVFTGKGRFEYQHVTEGYSKGYLDKNPELNWSKIFLPKMFLFESDQILDPIAVLVSKFIKDHIYYTTPINLSYNPLKQSRTIDFNQDPAHFVIHEPLYNNSFAKKIGSHNIFIESLNRGIFFRSPKNRREKNYWLPGLNAGIPLTPKKDEIHERCFMAHDFGHFIIPDLILSSHPTESQRKLYIVHRMMSEAFTLVMTDMVFVDTLFRSGLNYDFTKRKIYPLFQDLQIDLSDREHFVDHMKTLLRANVSYCLRGDCSHYRRMLDFHKKSYENLNLFKTKYMPFFVEDFRWTEKNYKQITANQQVITEWWQLVEPLRHHASLDLETVQEFSKKIQCDESDDIIDQVFEELFKRVIAIYTKNNLEIDPYQQRLKKAFYRYMMGQLALFSHYKSKCAELEKLEKIMISFLLNNETITLEFINSCRSFYEDIVDYMLKKNHISFDDHAIYKEMFPLFEPFFVHYDEELGYYPQLEDESKRILNI